jgi:hypothetical protein
MKRFLLITVVVLQFARLALPSLGVVNFGDCGTSCSFSCALTLVNWNMVTNSINPVKTLLNISARMADNGAPFQPAHNDQRQRPIETTLIVSPSPELVKTNTPLWPISGFLLIATMFVMFLLVLIRRGGIVLCRIQHLFARAREGICAIMQLSFFLRKSLLIRNTINRDFHLITPSIPL